MLTGGAGVFKHWGEKRKGVDAIRSRGGGNLLFPITVWAAEQGRRKRIHTSLGHWTSPLGVFPLANTRSRHHQHSRNRQYPVIITPSLWRRPR